MNEENREVSGDYYFGSQLMPGRYNIYIGPFNGNMNMFFMINATPWTEFRWHVAGGKSDLSTTPWSQKVFSGAAGTVKTLDGQYEEAAFMLGASRMQTFYKVIIPELRPAILTGFGLAFARGIGEYGSVIYISGNSAREQTQVVSYVIMQKLGYIDYASATAIALVMLILSFLILLAVNIVQMQQSARTNIL